MASEGEIAWEKRERERERERETLCAIEEKTVKRFGPEKKRRRGG